MKREAFVHPKMMDLADWIDDATEGALTAAGVDPDAVAVGYLDKLWNWAAVYAQAGDVGRYTNRRIAVTVGWRGDADEFVAALVKTGWLDEDDDHRLIIHDWPDHCEDSVHARLARARECFADGTVPKLTKLDSKEKAEATEHYFGKKQETAASGNQRHPAAPNGSRRPPSASGGGPPGPGPIPEPIPRPHGMGTVPDTQGASDGRRVPDEPRPSPETKSENYLQRNPGDSPEGVDPRDWVVACDLAALIESAKVGGDVVGRGSVMRAAGLVGFAEVWAGRPFCRDPSHPWDDIAPALRAAITKPKDGDLSTLKALRKYPDGAYPADAPGRPSRLERLVRNHLEGTSGGFMRAVS